MLLLLIRLEHLNIKRKSIVGRVRPNFHLAGAGTGVFLIIKRFMHRIGNNIPRISPTVFLRSPRHSFNSNNHPRYATYQVHRSNMFKCSNEGLNNNPVIAIPKKTKTIVFQHPEIIKTTCNFPGCTSKICSSLCSKLENSSSIGHVTHSPDYGVFLSDTDLKGTNNSQNYVPYKTPHSPEGTHLEEQKTTNLQDPAILKVIKDNENK